MRRSSRTGRPGSLRDHITIGSRCVVGAGALLLGDADADGVYIGTKTERRPVPSTELRKI